MPLFQQLATLTPPQRSAALYAVAVRRKTARSRTGIGISAAITLAASWIAAELPGPMGDAWLVSVIEWLAIAGAAIAVFGWVLLLVLERRTRAQMRVAGIGSDTIRRIWDMSDRDAVHLMHMWRDDVPTADAPRQRRP